MALTGGTLSTKIIELVGDLDIDATVKNINRSITQIERTLKQRDIKVEIGVELFGRVKDIEKDISALQRKISSSSSIKNIKLGVELKDTTIKDINEQIRSVQNKVDGSSVSKLKLDIDFDFKGSATTIKNEMQEIQQFVQRYSKELSSTNIIDLDKDAQNVKKNTDLMIGSIGELNRGTAQVSDKIQTQMRQMTGSTGKFSVNFKQDFNGAIEGATASISEADGTIRKFNYALEEGSQKLQLQSRSTKEAGDQQERLATSMKQVENAQRQLNEAISKSPEWLNGELIEQAQNHLKVARSMEEQNRVTDNGTDALKELNEHISKINNSTKEFNVSEKFRELGEETQKAVIEFEKLGGSEEDVKRFTSTMNDMTLNSVEGMNKLQQEVQQATNEIIQSSNRLDGALSDIAKQDFARAVDERDIQSIKNYVEEIYGAEVATVQLSEKNDRLGNSVDRLKVNMQEQNGVVKSYTADMSRGFDGADRSLRQVDATTKTLNTSTGKLDNTFGSIVSRVTQYVGVIEVLQTGMRLAREMVTEILEIDAQMTELARVSDPSLNLNVILSKSVDLAKELGASVEEVVGSVAEMARTYGEFNENQLLAMTRTATIMDNVSDLSLAESTETLVGAMNAFNISAEDSIGIVDSLNEVNDISLPLQQCS